MAFQGDDELTLLQLAFDGLLLLLHEFADEVLELSRFVLLVFEQGLDFLIDFDFGVELELSFRHLFIEFLLVLLQLLHEGCEVRLLLDEDLDLPLSLDPDFLLLFVVDGHRVQPLVDVVTFDFLFFKLLAQVFDFLFQLGDFAPVLAVLQVEVLVVGFLVQPQAVDGEVQFLHLDQELLVDAVALLDFDVQLVDFGRCSDFGLFPFFVALGYFIFQLLDLPLQLEFLGLEFVCASDDVARQLFVFGLEQPVLLDHFGHCELQLFVLGGDSIEDIVSTPGLVVFLPRELHRHTAALQVGGGDLAVGAGGRF